MEKSKKIWIAVGCTGLVLITIILVLALRSQWNEATSIKELGNGDNIVFNIRDDFVFSNRFDNGDFVVLSQEDFEDWFDSKPGEKIEWVNELAPNCIYQVARESGGSDFDEIYQWETAPYKDPQGKIINLIRNAGNERAVAERGYGEYTIYEDRPLRLTTIGDWPGTETLVKSTINGKSASVVQLKNVYNSGRGCFVALIENIDNQGRDGFLIADNVDKEYFVALLEEAAGREYTLPEDTSKEPDTAIDESEIAEAREKIEYLDVAEKIIYDEFAELIEAGDARITFWEDGEYFPTGATYEGKAYNVSCWYTVDYKEKITNEIRYMNLKRNSSGVIVEEGKPCVVIESER